MCLPICRIIPHCGSPNSCRGIASRRRSPPRRDPAPHHARAYPWSTPDAYDTDVIKLYLDPSGLGGGLLRGKHREGYTRIFRHDEDYKAITLAAAISEFLLVENRSATGPILILPPLEWELQDVFYGLVRDAIREHSAVREELNEKLRKLEAALKGSRDDERKLEILLAGLPELAEFLFGMSGPSQQIMRFEELTKRSKLSGLRDGLRRGAKEFGPEVSKILDLPKTVEDWVVFTQFTNNWQERIQSHPGKIDRRPELIENDAKVLARVELVNLKLGKFGFVLIHVTGDRAILDIGQRYAPYGSDESFTSLFLRHPRTYLPEKDVLFSAQDWKATQSAFLRWFEVLLATYTKPGGISRRRLLELLDQEEHALLQSCEEVLQLDTDAFVSVRTSWENFSDALSLKRIEVESKSKD